MPSAASGAAPVLPPPSCSRYARFEDLKRYTTSFSTISGYTARRLAVGVGDNAREMNVAFVSHSFMSFFDAPPALGRYFTAAEDSLPEGPAVVVLSHPMWQTQFGGRADVLGTAIQVGSVIYTAIGVAPRGFAGIWPERPPAAYMQSRDAGVYIMASLTLLLVAMGGSWVPAHRAARTDPSIAIRSE